MTLPNYNSGSGFYNPGASYQGPAGSSFQLPSLARNIAGTNDIPQGAYLSYLAKRGLGGFGSRARQAQQMFGQTKTAYDAATLDSNFNLWYPEFLDQSRVADTFNSMSYEAQGLDPQRFGQRKYQWSMRG